MLPFKRKDIGSQLLLSYEIDKIKSICISLGLVPLYSNYVVSTFNNFDFLLIGEDHPCRSDHKTISIKPYGEILRTHCTVVQSSLYKYLKEHNSFISECGFFNIGPTFRSETTRTHIECFTQLDVFIIGKNASIKYLFDLSSLIINKIFEDESRLLTFKSAYFPFTKPSFEGYIFDTEVLGCGMMHQSIIEKISPESKGIALGIGIERVLMSKYGVNDIRKLVELSVKNFVW